VRAYRRQGWTVFPVNPREAQIDGLPVFARLTDIPHPVDRAAFYVPPEIGITLLADVKAKGVRELFINPGAESEALMAEADRLDLPAIYACAIVDIGERP
jgi:hypothetical protein